MPNSLMPSVKLRSANLPFFTSLVWRGRDRTPTSRTPSGCSSHYATRGRFLRWEILILLSLKIVTFDITTKQRQFHIPFMNMFLYMYVQGILTLIFISFGDNFFTSLNKRSPKPEIWKRGIKFWPISWNSPCFSILAHKCMLFGLRHNANCRLKRRSRSYTYWMILLNTACCGKKHPRVNRCQRKEIPAITPKFFSCEPHRVTQWVVLPWNFSTDSSKMFSQIWELISNFQQTQYAERQFSLLMNPESSSVYSG